MENEDAVKVLVELALKKSTCDICDKPSVDQPCIECQNEIAKFMAELTGYASEP